jgi:hypothetical protein
VIDVIDDQYTSINKEKEKATSTMWIRFYEVMEEDYEKAKAGGSCLIKKSENDFISLLIQSCSDKRKTQQMANTRKHTR